jgi:2-polyprenyl-3-methyl-5-hydroxy-6-metoxy-1,4-benzoquinol methylase
MRSCEARRNLWRKPSRHRSVFWTVTSSRLLQIRMRSTFSAGNERLGGVTGKAVLELGPLEAGHSYMLEKAGAGSVLAIEANTRAYLKCLTVKEIFNLSRCRFECGDFVEFLSQTDQRFDLIVASGVLYHMKDPLRFLELLAQHTDRLFIWTHYYDADLINARDYLKSKFFTAETVPLAKGAAILHRHEYQTMLQSQSFCGGSEAYSKWINRDGLFAALKSFGFTEFEVNHETPDHPHGPALSVVALRK